jgi:hypothetical protein
MAYQSPQGLASLGRNGDSMLVHMSPSEVAGLQGLAMSQGGSLSINPQTGLPEAFKLGGFFKGLLPMFAGMATGGAGMPLWAGIAAGAATGALTNKDNRLMGAVTGGLGGYGGYNLGQGFAAAASPTVPSVPAAGGYVPGTVEGANTALNVAGTYNPALSPATTNLMNQANAAGFAGSAATGATGVDKSFLGGIDRLGPGVQNVGSGIKNVFTGKPGAFDAFKASFVEQGAKPISDLAAYGKIAMPVGGAALSGIEESDIYGKPINMASVKENEKYDPYKALNLSGDTGLRLVAEGGYIDGYATGGTIQSGGIRDLYGTPDNQPTISPGLSGFGLGRLNNLAGEQALNQAQTLGYAMGGPVSFADGGDSNKQTLELPSLATDAGPETKIMNLGNIGFGQGLVRNLAENMQRMQGNTSMPQDSIPDENNDSIIAKVTANLKADPNYKPANFIEEAIVKQLRGSDTMQETSSSAQGLGSLAPNTPMAPTYNASQAITPTYYAGMNAPRGYADGGETTLNLDDQPTLNVETGKQSYNTIQSALANSDNPQGRLLNKLFSFRPGGRQSIYDQFAAQGLGRLNKPQMAKGGYLNGNGDGMSDSIPATIEGKQPARLADGEFVVPADVVSHIGNGSSKAGSKKLYAMMDKVRRARTGHTKQGKQINADRYLPKVA